MTLALILKDWNSIIGKLQWERSMENCQQHYKTKRGCKVDPRIWIELKSDEIIARSIHFDNSMIISRFYTNSTPKTIIYCFKNINCSFSNNNMVFWWFELGWLHCPRLVFIIKGQIQHIFSRRELQITRGNFDYCSINGFLNATWFFQKLPKISFQHCDSRFKSCLFICLCKCCQAPSPSP